MFRRMGRFLAERLKLWIPDSFVFALALTLLVGTLAWWLTDSSGGAVLDGWFRGFWLLLEFGMQILLILVTGYAIALSSPATRLIDRIARRVRSPAQVYLAVLLLGTVLTLVSWSWVVLVAVLARELASRVKGIDYPYLTACVFLSSWSWVCGLSSSIPLLLNTEDNFLIETGVLATRIPVEVTLGSRLNLVYFAVGLVIVPIIILGLRPRGDEVTELDQLAHDDEPPRALTVAEEAEGLRLGRFGISDVLNNHWALPAVVAGLGFVFLGRYFAQRGLDLNLEVIIFALVMVGLAVHRTPICYVAAMRRACRNVSGILFQYPFYAGIMGLMMFTGLGGLLSSTLASHATALTLPAIAQFTAALVNFAIPSAGGEWAVIGPAFVEAAKSIGAELPPDRLEALIARISLAVAYGETSTNLLQPFFLLIVLPVMGAGVKLQARDVMGHMVIPFVAIYSLTAAMVTWVPM